MISSFADRRTHSLFADGDAKGVDDRLAAKAHRRLHQLNSATTLGDVAFPGNDLKKLRGSDIWQIRVDGQWRIQFRWVNGNAEEVRFFDPH